MNKFFCILTLLFAGISLYAKGVGLGVGGGFEAGQYGVLSAQNMSGFFWSGSCMYDTNLLRQSRNRRFILSAGQLTHKYSSTHGYGLYDLDRVTFNIVSIEVQRGYTISADKSYRNWLGYSVGLETGYASDRAWLRKFEHEDPIKYDYRMIRGGINAGILLGWNVKLSRTLVSSADLTIKGGIVVCDREFSPVDESWSNHDDILEASIGIQFRFTTFYVIQE